MHEQQSDGWLLRGDLVRIGTGSQGANGVLQELSVQHIRTPMRVVFGHARATRSEADSVVVHVRISDYEGYGECVPREYVTGESIESVLEAITTVALDRLGADLDLRDLSSAVTSVEALRLPVRLTRGGIPGLAAACALEMAVLDAIFKRFGRSIRELPELLGIEPEVRRGHSEPYGFTEALDTLSTLDDFAAQVRSRGSISAVKIKVGVERELDISRVAGMRARLGDATRICVDGNMAWSLEQAIEMVGLLAPYHVAWFEEPMRREGLEDYQQLRQRTTARIMLDESLCSYDQAKAAVAAGACDLFNIRISKCGGLIPSLRLVELAHRAGLGFQIGVQIGEQAILRSAGWHLAEMVRGFETFEAVPWTRMFADELIAAPLELDEVAGRCRTPTGPGLGIEVRADQLEIVTRRRHRWTEPEGWHVGGRA